MTQSRIVTHRSPNPATDASDPAQALSTGSRGERAGVTRKSRPGAVLALAFGHGAADFYPGYLPSVLPYLLEKMGLSLTTVGLLASLQSFSTSLVQPALGYLVDARQPRPWAAWGLLAAALLLGAMTLAPNVTVLAILIVLGGLGVALYHPQGAAMVARLSNGRAGTAMSIFATGGSIGHAVGPLAAVIVIENWGLESLALLAVPGVLVAWVVYGVMREPLNEMAETRRPVSLRASLAGCGWRLALLLAVMTLRAGATVGVSTMLPIYLEAKGLAIAVGGTAIFIYRLGGAVGVVFGGPLSDRIGRKLVIVASFLLAMPFLYMFFHTSGLVRMLHLALASTILTSSTPVNTVMAQEVMPRTAAVASGLMMGVGWALGSLSVTLIGFLADRHGIEATLPVVALGLVAAGLVLSLFLPRTAPSRPSG